MIQFDNVSKLYKGNGEHSLVGASFSIEPGEFVSIVGPSGSGKTSIIRLLLGEEKPTEGTVYFDTIDVHRLRRSEIPRLRRRIGTVFQDYKLLRNKTAFENIAFAMETAGRSDDEIITDVPYVLELVGLSHKAKNFPDDLSGGERQRLAIARAIINQPEIVVADEPTGNLDPVATDEVIKILKKINDLGTTVILATHDKHVVDGLKKRVITLKDGHIVKDIPEGKYDL